jgi:hypothetical protein
MSNSLLLKDRFGFEDKILMQNGGLWAKTEIIGSYGNFVHGPGKTTFDMPDLFHESNIVPVGGVSYAFQQLFQVPETQITIPTMHTPLAADYSGGEGIGKYTDTPTANREYYHTPDGTRQLQYKMGHAVQLFGLGITGTAENDVTKYHPDYRENKISINKVNPDGLKVVGKFLPFRFTTETLSTEEQKKYFGKTASTDTNDYGYFLKRFESDPVIKHIWKTGADVENEIPVENTDMWQNIQGLNAVESFIEIELKVSHKDLKEYFAYIGEPDRARFNTIALFTGCYMKKNASGEETWSDTSDPGEYVDVTLFSKLCINPEYVDLVKDMNVLYRIYGS